MPGTYQDYLNQAIAFYNDPSHANQTGHLQGPGAIPGWDRSSVDAARQTYQSSLPPAGSVPYVRPGDIQSTPYDQNGNIAPRNNVEGLERALFEARNNMQQQRIQNGVAGHAYRQSQQAAQHAQFMQQYGQRNPMQTGQGLAGVLSHYGRGGGANTQFPVNQGGGGGTGGMSTGNTNNGGTGTNWTPGTNWTQDGGGGTTQTGAGGGVYTGGTYSPAPAYSPDPGLQTQPGYQSWNYGRGDN